ncbi:Apc13p protein-domain-containing protein [Paecilomyces variotii]|uniref:Apc13p protein-domain-containing protein n=1 Tax=Byssochlamys spectabilis TaxID=264951 RepID=A0A443I195_BYSSP|nr:Apc13p protein-domain-containing protein [Paecilomyces variotii]KAJ9219233.1 hypothetical protein DTO169C6_8426 [Paecilomyces variotii]KAJ9244397.1 hypothetical protein DTO169E5_1615 [Paecilomyces variotii]KAJ9247202.1 hypothetical protein DTO207G8_8261 [Paecilomyces variotii]KAJ9309885.1 hypothetical protein DTO217A2_523 [Paecilomyces variotii]KAJ9313680.1 hypothetical protein DTO271D3_5984 [Paecilomyces variotii]
MSKDSSPTYIHMHQPRLADFFEDFTRPHTSLYTNIALQSSHNHPHAASGVTYGSTASGPTAVPSFLPIEDIYVLPQYQPLNPEDEDDVVPDQHAAFGITRAMENRREAVWRDLGLEELVSGRGRAGANNGVETTRRWNQPGRMKQAGALMGGRRVVCLR